jgi:Zn-dependent protease with chaperone function
MSRRLLSVLVIVLLLASALPSPVCAQGTGLQRDQEFEQQLLNQLKLIAPEAVPVFQAATRAMDSGDYAAAKQGFEEVLRVAPGFSPAARRLSYVELQLGHQDSAIQWARTAFDLDPSSYNESALALALLSTRDTAKVQEGLTHARSAVQKTPDDDQALLALLMGGALIQDVAAIRQASTKLVQVAPQFPLGHFFYGLVAAEDGQWETSEAELLLAEQLGMDHASVQEVLDQGVSSQASQARWLRAAGIAFVIWIVVGVVFFLTGVVLSKLTVAAVRRHVRQTEYRVSRSEGLVRNIYRAVVGLTSGYFYISVPFLILTVLAVTGGIFYLFFAIGRIPLQLAAALGLGAIYTLIAIVRSVFSRVQESEPGRALTIEEAPQLWAMTERVAQRIGTRPIKTIYINPGTGIAVTERGGMWKKLRGAGQRCLIVGLGVLPGMTQGEFEAVLAHEYGHFSNRDTAGGNIAWQVQTSLRHMAYRLAMSGQARWYNPAWLFVNGFYRMFLRVTLGASRLQEILADRYAALYYGTQNFIDGLTHVIRQSLVFDYQINQEVHSAAEAQTDLHNLYTLSAPSTVEPLPEIDKALQEALNRPTSPYDSHPGYRERIDLVQHITIADSSESNTSPMWELLPTAEALQAEMTHIVQTNVRQRMAQAS